MDSIVQKRLGPLTKGLQPISSGIAALPLLYCSQHTVLQGPPLMPVCLEANRARDLHLSEFDFSCGFPLGMMAASPDQ